MSKFEQQFEDLDVQTSYMESVMGQSTTLTTPQNEVDTLVMQVADEHGLEVQMDLPGVSSATAKEKEKEAKRADELEDRLAKLRNEG